MVNRPVIRLHGKTFALSIPYERIEAAVVALAARINRDYSGKEKPLFLGVLNGAFMFMAELMKNIGFDCDVSFVRIASYHGTCSASAVKEVIGLTDSIEGRHVIIVEDIVDTGNSIEYLTRSLTEHKPASIAVATLLFKPECYTRECLIDYYALEVPDRFIVGFGLDYDGLGRNYRDIYELVDTE